MIRAALAVLLVLAASTLAGAAPAGADPTRAGQVVGTGTPASCTSGAVVRAVRAGGLITVAGMGLALAFPTVPGSIIGFAAAGFGVATVIPAAMRTADELPGLRPGTGLTMLTWLMRFGFLGAPLIVGVVSDAYGLRIGLLSVPAAGVAIILLAGALRSRRGT